MRCSTLISVALVATGVSAAPIVVERTGYGGRPQGRPQGGLVSVSALNGDILSDNEDSGLVNNVLNNNFSPEDSFNPEDSGNGSNFALTTTGDQIIKGAMGRPMMHGSGYHPSKRTTTGCGTHGCGGPQGHGGYGPGGISLLNGDILSDNEDSGLINNVLNDNFSPEDSFNPEDSGNGSNFAGATTADQIIGTQPGRRPTRVHKRTGGGRPQGGRPQGGLISLLNGDILSDNEDSGLINNVGNGNFSPEDSFNPEDSGNGSNFAGTTTGDQIITQPMRGGPSRHHHKRTGGGRPQGGRPQGGLISVLNGDILSDNEDSGLINNVGNGNFSPEDSFNPEDSGNGSNFAGFTTADQIIGGRPMRGGPIRTPYKRTNSCGPHGCGSTPHGSHGSYGPGGISLLNGDILSDNEDSGLINNVGNGNFSPEDSFNPEDSGNGSNFAGITSGDQIIGKPGRGGLMGGPILSRL